MLVNRLAFAALSLTAASLTQFFKATFNVSYNRARLFDAPPSNGSKYDYIVVGSGTSGSVVAGRLAEAGQRILLVEAGGPPHFFQVSLARCWSHKYRVSHQLTDFGLVDSDLGMFYHPSPFLSSFCQAKQNQGTARIKINYTKICELMKHPVIIMLTTFL